jgi:hypothetical protein
MAFKRGESQHLYHGTAKADVMIFELDTMLREGKHSGLESKSRELEAAILGHIADEEGSAFPDLREHANPHQFQMLTAAVRAVRGSFHYDPRPL